jgi:hypothetical protein
LPFSKSQLRSISSPLGKRPGGGGKGPGGPPPCSDVVLHGFACASCTELGRIVNPTAMTVAAASMAAIKTVVFFILTEGMKAFVYLR